MFVKIKVMKLYTRDLFEDALNKNKDRIIVRNGEFVGLFKYLPESKKIILTKKINNHSYGFKDELIVHQSGKYWGSGGSNGISAVVSDCNESHLIPKGYDLRKKEHLNILNKCLGGCYNQVHERIIQANPNKDIEHLCV